MLSQIFIRNIAVIESASVDFKKGFNVFTGETGAGKSILIDSINAVLGGRTSRDLVRTGTDKAVVKAVFSDISPNCIEKLNDLGIEPDENGEILVSREITSEGKSTCRINMEPATVGTLKELSSMLIDVHGQHDSISLQNPDVHIRYIDSFGSAAGCLEAYGEKYRQCLDIDREIKALSSNESDKQQRIEMLHFAVDEIEAANIEENEEEELQAKSKKINASEKLLEIVEETKDLLSGSDFSSGIVDSLNTCADNAVELAEFFPQFKESGEKIKGMYYELDDFLRDVSDCADELDFDPSEQNEIESRLDVIYRLKKKYGGTVENMFEKLKEYKEELDSIEFSDEKLERLSNERQKLYSELEKLASDLSEKRKAAAAEFEDKVGKELEFLNMPNVKFKVNIEKTEFTPSGTDGIEFYISTNVGEPLKPLAKIASGGELSRIMLSIKNVLADRDDMGTLIFDEIDTGISGLTATKVGRKLKQVSGGRQIICVTHLAQVACFADNHLLITKEETGDRTFTSVESLDEDGRINELARIMGGNISDSLRNSARELLQSTYEN